uniref:DNA-directed DNA polymerase n=1 Tax=Meloidogyne enterolobii TaxID=390850 RepID=A0A6V7TTI5_MELEN|nr:unnamed protein product [Meloidogyne enterolobii]
MDYIPPTKRARAFFIDNLLSLNQSGGGAAPQQYIEQLENTTKFINKFKITKNYSKFLISNIPADPEALLSGIFQHCFNEAVNNAKNNGLEPEELSCTVSSELLDSDIWIPLRPTSQNTFNTLLNQFNKVSQSKKQAGVTLWGKPFSVIVMVVDKKNLPNENNIIGGAPRRIAPVHHQIKQQNLIKINNNDGYCLFYSLLAALVRLIGNLSRSQFYEYVHGRYGQRGKFENDTLGLMEQVGAPLGREEYNAEEWVPPVVDFWNEKYSGRFCFKVFIFDCLGHYRPCFKYGPENYNSPLLLYFDGAHFNGVTSTGGLFGRPYCLECETVYERPQSHSATCRARCLNCSRVGPLYPCPPRNNFLKKCDRCLKKFINEDCFDHHLSSGFCQQSKRCENCGVIWDTKNNTRGGRNGHVCNERELFLLGFTPEMLKRGNKMYEMKVKVGKKSLLIFRDSFNLMPMSLASLVPAFALEVEDKPFFPHLANQPKNYGKEVFPIPSDYFADGMMPEKRKEFDRWYSEHKDLPFLLDEELASYCTNDVEILLAALIAFRREFLDVTKRGPCLRAASNKAHNGIDVLRESMTIASACMNHFRTNHLKENHLALVPEKGYDNVDNQSRLALKFMKWYEQEHEVKIQTAHSDGGEKKVGNYKLDGWIEEEKLGIEVHILNQDVRWSRPEDNNFELAILKVFVIPPRSIDIPVLPMKVGEDDERLLFPLCSQCAREHPEGGVNENYSCPHSDQQRGWVSTCTSLELNAALEEGYIVTKVFRVLEYDSSDDQLFAPYISEFMAAKIHSSGFDNCMKGNFEKEEEFIKECKEKFGINIDRSKMGPNKGKRTQAKLMLNNLWGRFSLRNFGLSQCAITDNPAELHKYYNDKSIEITGLDELTDEILLITYIKKKDWIEEHNCSNVVISLWTTSAARIHLLRAMQKVVRTTGCKLLYTDTDSLIFAHPINNCPLQLGPHLGELTDEYPSHNILEYCCGGAKQYGLQLRRKNQPGGDKEYVLKVRGMTLNWDVLNNQGLQYNTFREQVLSYAKTGENNPIDIIYPNFLRPSIKDGRVTSQSQHKLYKPVVSKGIIRPSDFSILNFGFVNNRHPRISPP